jgi:hemerythrin-like domain-containing protein
MNTRKPPGAMTRDMQMVHTGMRREFRLMPALVRGVNGGDVPRAEIVADHAEFIGLALHHHHHTEDENVWPRLLERCPEEIAPIVHAMEDHHERIAQLLTELTAGLEAWRGTADAERGEALAAILDRLNPVLFEHLAAEEQQVLPLIEEHITAAEWDQMAAGAVIGIPQDKLPLLLGLMMYEGDPQAVQQTLENVPPEARSFMAEMAPKAYAAHAEQLYGTPTPPRVGTDATAS